jgi:hypothetical protein
MDEESWRERILQRAWGLFPQRKAESKGRRETSAEVRLLQGGITALEFEGIALPDGPWARRKLGVGNALFACPPSLLRWFGGVKVGAEKFFIEELGKNGRN